MKIRHLALIALLFLPHASYAAVTRDVWEDRDKDGRKESHVFYEGSTPLRVEMDMNGDGKPDAYIEYKNGVRSKGIADKNYDGKPDQWLLYSGAGRLIQRMSDTNGDGKPDQFYTFLKGRRFEVKEWDRNFDGKVDRRAFSKWDQEKTTAIWIGTRMNHVMNPGYTMLWREEDNNYDGITDVYQERPERKRDKDDKTILTKAVTSRVGQHMDTGISLANPEEETVVQAPVGAPGAPGPAAAPVKRSPYGHRPTVEERIEKLNEKYGLTNVDDGTRPSKLKNKLKNAKKNLNEDQTES